MSSSKEIRKARLERSKSSKASSSKANEALGDIDFYSEDSEDFDDHGDDFRPKRKKRNFEFTESAGMFRLLKMFIFMQMIALLSDHTSIKLPLLFTLLEHGILYYVVHFYSRPLMDVVYIVEYFFVEIHSLLQYLHLPSGGENSKIEITRKLGNSNYASVPEKPIQFGADFAFLDPKSWHTIQMFTHYFLGIMFFVLTLIFTLKFWEISDYTNRDEVRKWLHQYVADGWSRRGGLNIAIGVCKACMAICAVALGLYSFSREFTTNAFPESRYIGTCLAMIASTTFCVWLIGFQFLKATESAFTRYVSQNVSYTSSIILKRVVKSKTELAISLLILLFMPIANNLVMALTMVTDWNDNWTMPHRIGVNFYVPCYLMAFPPYRENDRDTTECPVYYSNSPDLPITSRRSGYYKDHTILSCDSYFGISIFTLSLISMIFVLIGFFWIIYRFQKTVVDEFISSRWVSTVVALITIKDDEESHYVSKFSFVERYALAIELECRTQFKHLLHACRWLMVACFELVVDICKIAIAPVLIVLAPFFFLADRIFVLVCNDWSMEGRRRQMRSQLREADEADDQSAAGSYVSEDVDTKSVSSMQRILNENQKLLEEDSGVATSKTQPKSKKEEALKSRRQRKLDKIVQYDEEAIAVDHHIRSIPEILVSSFSHFILNLPCVTIPSKVASNASRRLQELVMRSDTLAQIKLTLSSWKRYIVGKKHSRGINVADIGGAHAPWRISTKLIAKCRSIRNLHRRINEELRRSRMEFIMDHQLTICIFDTVMDSSGLFFLVNNFQWYRLYWIMVIILEMAILALGGAYLNYIGTWQEKIAFFVAIIAVFGVITYISNPFTEDTDKWLDFLGRILVCSTGLSIVICDLIVPGSFYEEARKASVFRPWDSIAMIQALDPAVALSLLFIDFAVVFYFFAYIYYVLKSIGVYGYFVRKVESWKFTLHDRVLDFLVEKVDEQTIGFENIHSGLLAIQQWDDIITNQRRYALLTWPDVRPPHLMTCMQKMVEVQWSALFNLTLENLRSSLGLSLLHTTMCAADSEISRWLIEYHQELLTAQDSQRDTPILIALKECAFYLMKFGEQNNGQLDDGTSFSDDAFNSYYPEVEGLREEVMEHGDFIPNSYEDYFLDSKELQCIVSNGYFVDTRDTDEADKLPSFLQNIPKKRALTDILLGPEGAADKTQEAVQKAKQAKEEAAQRRKQAKLEAEQAYKEKLSLYCKRFPEDEYLDDFESGLMTSWKMIGLKVPINNIFLDMDVYSDDESDNDLFEPSGVELVSKKSVASENISQFIDEADYVDNDNNEGLYDDENEIPEEDAEFEPLTNDENREETSKSTSKKNNTKTENSNAKKNGSNESKSIKGKGTVTGESVTAATLTSSQKKRKAIADKKKVYSKHVNEKNANIFNKELYNKYDSKWHHFFMNLFTNFENQTDLEYAIPTAEQIIEIHPKQSIPINHERYQAIKDWDYIRKSTKKSSMSSFLKKIQSNKEISDDISAGTPFSLHNDSNIPGMQGTRLSSVQDREIRYKICKFAEIFMSNEVARNCCNMKWDINAFKELNKLASFEQGQLAQNLAMALNLNPPDGFARISEWTLGLTQNVFDDVDEVTIPLIVRGALAVVSTAENFGKKLKNVSNIHKAVGSHLKRVLPSGSSGRRQHRTSSDRISGIDDQPDNNQPDGEQNKNHSVAFSDRTIYYLSECLVASRDRIELKDAEISVYGRKGWRAIMRALRRRNTTFVIPSTFMGPKPVILRHLILPRNELDDGDCVLLSEIILYQQGLIYLDLNHNRIATRGFNRLCRVFKSHESITTLRIDSNRIGPAAGKSIGIVLKFSKTLKFLSISSNYLGPMIRFPTPIHRQKIDSAARDIFVGLRSNNKLEVLDLSYNHLGPILGEVVPPAVIKHPKLTSLNLAGNDIGNEMGIRLTFALAGRPGAHKEVLIREAFYKTLKERAMEKLQNSQSGAGGGGGGTGDISHEDVATMIMNEDEKESTEKAEKAARIQGLLQQNGGNKKASVSDVDKDCTQKSMLNDYFTKQKKASRKKSDGNDNNMDDKANKSCQLSELILADNELGYLSGYGLGELIKANKSLTVLDISSNSLGNVGGVAITDALEKCYGIPPRDFFKNVLEKIEESKYVGRDAEVKKKLITNLTVLKMSRNGLGSNFASGIMTCLADPNCTLIDVDISDNPLGVFIHRHGDVIQSGLDTRLGLGGSKSLLNLDLSRTSFMPTQLVPVFGGMAFNRTIRKLIIQDVRFDEPTALQCAHAMEVCESLHHVDFLNCNMGPRGGVLIVNKLNETRTRITYANLSGNKLGPVSAAIIGNLVTMTDCTIHNLYLANNDFLGAGGEMVIRGLAKNASITDIDLSSNALDASCGEALGIVARGLYIQGRKVSDCALHRLVMSDNPDIGSSGARALLRGLLVGQFRHVELSNIGAGPSCASIIAKGVRDVALTWEYFDFSGNNITRPGMNEIFWALRQNRRIRVIHLSDVRAGPKFGTDEDALLKHGISVVRCLRANVILRELDLSFNGLSSGAGINILDGLLDNYVIKKICLRGNVLDDEISEKLAEFLRYNNIIEELDLGDNRLGYDCCFSIAEGIEWNRSIRTLLLDKNELGNAGTATLSAFVHGFTMNCNVRVLNLDTNKLGPAWGDKIAEIIARNATLLELSLRDNHFDQFAARKLVSAYEHSEYLRQLALSKDEIGLQLWDKLREIYRNKLEMVHPDDMNLDTEIQEDSTNILKTYM